MRVELKAPNQSGSKKRRERVEIALPTHSRRSWICNTACGLGALSLGSFACRQQRQTPDAPTHQSISQPDAAASVNSQTNPEAFHVVEAQGSYRDIGFALGRGCRESISAVWADSSAIENLRNVAQQRQPLLQAMNQAASAEFPQLIEEIQGMAQGAGLSFDDLFAWNCRSELFASVESCPPGCSTVGIVGQNGTMILGHNEDGGESYENRMVLLKARPESGPAFTCLVYPGTIPGNGPGFNSAGIAQTTNYIAPCQPQQGIPRYFLGRAVLEAQTLESAESIATTYGRAFPWHHNLASLRDGRLISLETWPGRHNRRLVDGLHLHTNHLVHEEMTDLEEQREYLGLSSMPRLEALQRFSQQNTIASREDVLAALADRSGSPCKVCRRPNDEVSGMTLATAIFESPQVGMTLIEGPPCDSGPQIHVTLSG